ncbi:discoidin domain-containing receptor 2-like [Agrilus planipennis]|uniref:Discoidin domain-containing receptor 2-like n=1 Tax=Agrilus planipennis TaxID=224129 RepID=A0A1W4WM55_AGRPL|nr:discoidin domain-containing receptor 2-like [Agrilus planipennis]
MDAPLLFPRIVPISFFLLLLHVSQSNCLDISQCIAPLGMESGDIKDEDITASSSFDSGNVGPRQGRLKVETNGGAWCPQTPATAEPEEWLQIDLHTVHLVTSVGTQGRFGNGQGVEYSEAYILEYWRPRLNKWIRYRNYRGEEILNGNINTYLESKTELDPPIWATKIRFLPYSYHKRTVCLRVEIYGCRWTDGIVSYSMPQGDKRGPNWEFYDSSYDGFWDDGRLKHGLGQLTDGKTGSNDFKVSFYEHSKGWVGWRNDTRNGKPIDVVFEFDEVREFTNVNIFCNNQFTKEVQVFAKAEVFFSIGGKRSRGQPITYEYMEDRIFEKSRNVSIKLHHRIGKYVKIQLHFAARWILLSEISFDSEVIKGNFTEEEDEQEISASTNVKSQGASSSSGSGSESPPNKSSPSPQEFGQYMGVIAGILSVLTLLVGTLVGYIILQQRRRKAAGRQETYVPSNCEKAALYSEPIVLGQNSTNTQYMDSSTRRSEYAVPRLKTRPDPPSLQDIFPKPPSFPPAQEHYYASTEICNARFTPPSPPLSTPPLIRLSRQPRYVSNSNHYVGP